MLLSKNTPLYHKLKDIIRDKIDAGEWSVDSLIPPEVKLCEDYGLSRTTVRQAIVCLENEGLLRRVQGKGTYVCKPPQRKQITRYTEFGLDITAKGQATSIKVLDFDIMQATDYIAKKLKIKEKDEIFRIRRLKSFNDIPVLLSTAYLPKNLYEGLTHDQIIKNSLYQLFENKFDIHIQYCDDYIEAVVPDEYESRVLQIDDNCPVILLIRKTFDQHNRIVEFTKGIIVTQRADYVKLNNE